MYTTSLSLENGWYHTPPNSKLFRATQETYLAEFARPEVALNLALQNNITQNHLTIHNTGAEVREIEAQAEPVREKVRAMFKQYRPQGDGQRRAGARG